MNAHRKYMIVLAIIMVTMTACSLTQPPKNAAPTTQAIPTEPPVAQVAPAEPSPAPDQPTAAPTPVVDRVDREDGWTVYSMPEEGFSIALPPQWEKIDMDPETVKSSLETVKEKNPAFAEVLSTQITNMASQGIKFYGMDLSSEAISSGFANNVNVLIQQLQMDLPLDTIRQVNVGQLENMENVIKPVNYTSVKLPAGDAIKLSYQMGISDANGNTILVSIVQYMLVENKALYVVTAGASEAMAAQYSAVFDQFGQEFQILP